MLTIGDSLIVHLSPASLFHKAPTSHRPTHLPCPPQIGDASAAQSPLSFGGFGCMMRHLPRLARGLHQALDEDRLARGDLAWLQPYQPSLAASWLFQRSMSIGVGQALYPAGYPHTPAYAVQEAGKAGGEGERTAAVVGAEGVMGGAAAEVPLVLGAGAGPGAAFQEAAALAARTAASLGARVGWQEGGRFAAGAADPSDYLDEEGPEGAAAGGGAGPRGAVATTTTSSTEALFDRDFRALPTFLKLPYRWAEGGSGVEGPACLLYAVGHVFCFPQPLVFFVGSSPPDVLFPPSGP